MYLVTSTPHIRDSITVNKIMFLVTLALIPAGLMGVIFFGVRALIMIGLCVGCCAGFEAAYQKITKQEITVNDYSALVTGLLLAYNIPPSAPFWLAPIGSAVAIILAKQLFGGLGQNFINPALAGRAFLTAAYMPHMVGGFYEPTSFFSFDAVASPTPLAEGITTLSATGFYNLFLGAHGGTIGEVSAIAIILGGLFLLFKKIITWHIPVAYLATVALLALILVPFTPEAATIFTFEYSVLHLFSGGLLLGAFFMATDYSSSPITPMGKLIMGVGCGLFTMLIRLYGGYPEGVSYAILFMNLWVPLINRFTKSRVFGTLKTKKQN